MIPGFERNKRDGKRVPERVAFRRRVRAPGFPIRCGDTANRRPRAGGHVQPRAATITVNNLTDPTNTFANGFCTLREAINNANASGNDVTGGDCAVGSGNDNIQFSVTGTIALRASLPVIDFILTISGPTASPPSITIDGGGKVEAMLSTGTLTLQYLTIANG